MELDFGEGRRLIIREWQRTYDATFDGPGVEVWTHYNGEKYWCRSKIQPGKSLREARERALKAIEAAVRACTPGEIILDPPKKEATQDEPSIPVEVKRGPGRPKKVEPETFLDRAKEILRLPR